MELQVNSKVIHPIRFDSWSFPPDFEPKNFSGKISFEGKGDVAISILGGLTKSGDPSGGEYGAYFYCNNRLVDRANKSPEVGFRQMRIGQPHPSVSLARVIVTIKGPSQ